MRVKDLLKQKLPPTTADAKMTKEHTVGSHTHQIRHIADHAKAVVEQNGKLHAVDSKKAHSEAQRVLDALDTARAEIEKCLHKKGC